MSKLFRSLIRKQAWNWEFPRPEWLAEGDIPAAPLVNLIPRNHELSVYEVNDDRKRIQRVAAALALKRENASDIDNVEFIVFDESLLTEVGIEINRAVLGETCDPEVNAWHRELIHVSADKLVALTKRILPSVLCNVELKKELREAFLETCKKVVFDWEMIKVKNKEDLRRQCEGT